MADTWIAVTDNKKAVEVKTITIEYSTPRMSKEVRNRKNIFTTKKK